jgi:hypothetical protein
MFNKISILGTIHGGELELGDAEILRRCNVLHHKMSK